MSTQSHHQACAFELQATLPCTGLCRGLQLWTRWRAHLCMACQAARLVPRVSCIDCSAASMLPSSIMAASAGLTCSPAWGKQAGPVPRSWRGRLNHRCCRYQATHSTLDAWGMPPASIQQPAESLPTATQHPLPAALICCHAATQQHGTRPAWAHQQRTCCATGQHDACSIRPARPCCSNFLAAPSMQAHVSTLSACRATGQHQAVSSLALPGRPLACTAAPLQSASRLSRQSSSVYRRAWHRLRCRCCKTVCLILRWPRSC